MCPNAKCKAQIGMCTHEKILGVIVLLLAALFLGRRLG
jgi:hypothetical protein